MSEYQYHASDVLALWDCGSPECISCHPPSPHATFLSTNLQNRPSDIYKTCNSTYTTCQSGSQHQEAVMQILACTHVFHHTCLAEWLERLLESVKDKTGTCALCCGALYETEDNHQEERDKEEFERYATFHWASGRDLEAEERAAKEQEEGVEKAFGIRWY